MSEPNASGTPQGRARGRWGDRPLRLAGSAAVVVVVGSVLFRVVSGPPAVTVPGYLAPSNDVVRYVSQAARSYTELRDLIRDAITQGMARGGGLWTSHPEFGTDQAAALWEQGRRLQFLSFAPFEVPEEPRWDERPHRNLSVETLYQSLTWLQAPARAYELTGNPAYQQDVRRYLLSWIDHSGRRPTPSKRMWYDGAVGYRTDVIVQLFRPVLAGALRPEELDTLLASLEQHGVLLNRYLSEPRFVGHNHALFHALSLYNLAVSFPMLRHASEWKEAARHRVSTLLPEMVELNEGVSLEQAAGYHFVALRLFAGADAFLRQHGDGLTSDELAVLDRMTAFGALLQTPTGQTPAIGDTGYRTRTLRFLEEALRHNITSPTARWVLSRGASGDRPPDASFFPTSGYAIVRPAYTAGDWQDDLQLIVDTSTRTKPHGHFDAMNVLLAARGAQLLIDSGGPYRYGDPARPDFLAAAAHNVVSADGAGELGPVFDLVESDDARHTVIAGTYSMGHGAKDRRMVVLLKPDVLVVIDSVEAIDGQGHRYDLMYHLPPDAGVTLDGDRGTATVDRVALRFQIASSQGRPARVIKGMRDPLIGWVTHNVTGEKVAAPVLNVRQRATHAWFVSAFQAAKAGSGNAPTVTVVERSGGRLAISVQADGMQAALLVTRDGRLRLAD